MKENKIDEFEFSQTHVFFWDKIERSNYLLDVYIECAKNKEEVDGRLVQHLLHNPVNDGGQWDMLVNLIQKHGLVPKAVYPDTHSSENSRRFNGVLNLKHRECCMKIKKMVDNGATDAEILQVKSSMLEEIYKVCCVCLGSPLESFEWEYYDTDKQHHKVGPISPRDFYDKMVKPFFDLNDKYCLVNDPRPTNPYNKLYTVKYLGNMSNGRPTLYINQPINVLKELAAKSIQSGEPVWFGCDVGKHFHLKKGFMDLDGLDYNLVFGIDVQTIDKSDRLIYGQSLMTHAMVLTGVSVEDENKCTKWRIENSWGDKDGDKGYLVMTDDWFSEYVYEVVVDKKYVPDEIAAIMKEEPTVLPPWDPMGALA